MPVIRLKITPFAVAQVKDVVAYYTTNATPAVAKRFRDEFKSACQILRDNPASGSLRFAHLMQEAELRTWSFNRFRFRIF